MTPVPLVFEAFKAPLRRKRGGSKPILDDLKERVTRLEVLVWLLFFMQLGGKLPTGFFGGGT